MFSSIIFSKPLLTVTKRQFQSSKLVFARILATDGVDDLCLQIFKKRGHQVEMMKTLPEAELIKVIGDYDGLVVRSATKVTAKLLQHAKKMRVVGRAGVGIDNIDVTEATKHGVLVMNTPDGNTVSTAQLTMSLLCNLARHIPAANMSIKEGKWDRKSFTGVEITNKVLGIIGCGRIGQVVANCAKNMGMTVIGYDPVMSKEGFDTAGITQVDLKEIWKRSDFITCHTPLTKDTKNLINKNTLALCKFGVRIINCARGGIVDETDLLEGLQSGRVAGAALDVYTVEPPVPKGDQHLHLTALLAHPNLICTPHLGASTDEAQINVARDIAEQMCNVLDQKDYFGVVNVPYMSLASQQHMKPFMSLAETIGAMHAQIDPSTVTKVEVRTYGGRDISIATSASRQLLQAKVLIGLIKNRPGAPVPDLVSAPGLAKELGIEAIFSTEPPREATASNGPTYWNLVEVVVWRADGQTSRITGAVLGDAPHIVQVDQYRELFAFKPDLERGGSSCVLCFRNDDQPGAVSQVLEVLHAAQINIATLHVARSQATGTSSTEVKSALCFMSLDDDVPTNTLNLLKSLPSLSHVAKMKLR